MTFLKLFLALLAFGVRCVLFYRWWLGPDKPSGRVDSLWRDEHTPETKPTNVGRRTW